MPFWIAAEAFAVAVERMPGRPGRANGMQFARREQDEPDLSGPEPVCVENLAGGRTRTRRSSPRRGFSTRG